MARTNKKLSKEALKKAARRHNWTLQWCWNYERMQASGMAYAMVPVMQELYDDNDEVCENLERHMQFYNCHPGASAAILGAAVALEEDYQPEMADSINDGGNFLHAIGLRAELAKREIEVASTTTKPDGLWTTPETILWK